MSSPLAGSLTLTNPRGQRAVAIGPFGPQTVRLAVNPSSPSAATTALEAALNAAATAPAFVYARVRLLFDRLLVLPGAVGVEHQAYLSMDVQADGPFGANSASATLLGNIARASHGATVRGEPVGDGNPSLAFQRFTLDKAPVTFVPGAAGMVSTLQVLVNQARWREVPTLYGRAPREQVYVTRVADNGATSVQFGDG